MSQVIALAGKGGTGKTTTAALLIRYLTETGRTPILAVDADPNANLNELLGLQVEVTLGEIKDELRSSVPDNMARGDFIEMRLNEAIIETDDFDLLVMGQPEGPGCYCAAHSFLSQALEKLLKNYAYVITDNEAGMEHLSRMNLRKINKLLIVSDASSRGVMTAGRIAELIKPLQLDVKEIWLLVNRAPQEIPEVLDDYVKQVCHEKGMTFLGYLKESPEIFEAEINRQSLLELPDNTPVIKEAGQLFEKLLKGA
ncbi:cobyrinic acid ac-diamide synthase [Thermodesulfatator indicus DSM 15286]|uniref:Cobyrinic acid ac-diamide synthase n=1 Tax=Thermodesulfatator indicus (strain DSM 15286 / JCM 11887 / CIR29812) TaxID=667014 RepID=F8A9Y4_THEID|nr:AAA family ATPase [Thermodesulfatator indicus]AEH44185.1 cobyrinic acid ac-diamide synthase [Thermodesulfatator indicus DSM 15286]